MLRNSSLRERYEKKKKERQDILGTTSLSDNNEDKKNIIFPNEGKFNNFCFVDIFFNNFLSRYRH